MIQSEKKIAVLIDADNTQLKALEAIMAELTKHGYIIVKRAYGDWSAPTLKNWKNVLNELAVQPIQQFAYTQGKNSSDAAMIIDAMDLLYSNKFNAFALISSDSDFTKLATRLKESQIYVYGVGERKTPIAFMNACDDFLYIDILDTLNSDEDEDKNQLSQERAVTPPKNKLQPITELYKDSKLIRQLQNAAEECSEDDGWAELGVSGSLIKRQFPDFDSRNYGYSKLSTLVQATDLFDIKQEKMKGTNATKFFYRDKQNSNKK